MEFAALQRMPRSLLSMRIQDHGFMQRIGLIILVCLCQLMLAAGAGAFQGDVSGGIALGYGSFSADQGGTRVVESDSFTQQYSLLYQAFGKVQEGRGGEYDFGLGYEWNSLSGHVYNSSRGLDFDNDIQTGKILFRGDINFKPGGLPFRLHVYSEDMRRSTLVEDSFLPAASDLGTVRTEGILVPHIADDLYNGQTIRTGATLLLGIRNGSYLGEYRDLLSAFPRLLADFQQIDRRDLHSNTPQHSRSRNLAFVSLNKKDNWLHFRYRDFSDFLDHSNDYEEKKYMLGTVDPYLMRRWINVTNWIQVSADGSLTRSRYQMNQTKDEDRYDLNLFVKADRQTWRAATFANYEWVRDVKRLEKVLEVPVFADGELSRETAWRGQLLSERRSTLDGPSGDALWDDDDLYGSILVEAQRLQRFRISPKFEAEVRSGDRGEGEALRAGVEVFSNRLFNPRTYYLGGASLAWFDGTAPDRTNVSYVETVLTGRVEHRLDDHWRVGGDERLIYGEGTLGHGMTEHLAPLGDLGLISSPEGYEVRSGTTLRSTTTLFVETDYRRHLRHRFEVIYDYLSADGSTKDQFLLRQRLDYDSKVWLVNMTNEYVAGDDVDSRNISSNLLGVGAEGATGTARFTHDGRASYRPSRFFEAGLSSYYDWRTGDQHGDAAHLSITQDSTYSFYVVNGMVRKIAEINQELAYEQFDASNQPLNSVMSVALGGNYYPTHYFWVGSRVRYRTFEPENQEEMAYYLMAGLTFEKLEIAADYAYGDRSKGDNGYAERVEHAWHVTMKKIF